MTFPTEGIGFWAHELFWAVVSVAGLAVAARRWRRHRKVYGWAVAAFVVMLAPVVVDPVRWPSDSDNPSVFFRLACRTLGFALLTVAIFSGRKPALSDDP